MREKMAAGWRPKRTSEFGVGDILTVYMLQHPDINLTSWTVNYVTSSFVNNHNSAWRHNLAISDSVTVLYNWNSTNSRTQELLRMESGEYLLHCSVEDLDLFLCEQRKLELDLHNKSWVFTNTNYSLSCCLFKVRFCQLIDSPSNKY